MRYFLGLDPDAKTKLTIESWREKALPAFPHPVPVSNFHITSLFLGQVSDNQLDQLCIDIDTLDLAAFSVSLNQLGYWSKPKILFLGSQKPQPDAEKLATALSGFAKQAKIVVQERPYVPHLTLVRKCPEHAPAPLFEPDFQCRFDALHLFESVSGKHGVHYPIRRSWPFSPLGPR